MEEAGSRIVETHSKATALYGYFRDEIKREDEITHHRMTTCMAFQGFLFAAQTFLISGPWSQVAKPTGCMSAWGSDVTCGIFLVEQFRVWAIGAIGAVGYVAAIVSMFGIIATRISIAATKKHFDGVLAESPIDSDWPQIHGRGQAFQIGNTYTIAVPVVLAALWAIYIAYYGHLVGGIRVPYGAFLFVALLLPLLIGGQAIVRQWIDSRDQSGDPDKTS